MTYINNLISRVIDPADINKKWCRSMNYQVELEQGWNNEPRLRCNTNQVCIRNEGLNFFLMG